MGITNQITSIVLQRSIENVRELTNQNVNKITKLEKSVEEQAISIGKLTQSIGNLESIVINLKEETQACDQTLVTAVILLDVKINIRNTLTDLRIFLNNIVIAANNMVTSDILPIEDLNNLIRKNVADTGKVPVFPISKSYLLYPFIEADITKEGLFLKIPLFCKYELSRYSFKFTDTCIKENSLILEHEHDELLIDKTLHFTNIETNHLLLEQCKSHMEITVCPSDILKEIKKKEGCLNELFSGKEPTRCTFKPGRNKTKITRIADENFVYNPNKEEIIITCGNETIISRDCNRMIPQDCAISTENLRVSAQRMKKTTLKVKHRSIKDLTLPQKIEIEKKFKLAKEKEEYIKLFGRDITLISSVIMITGTLILTVTIMMKIKGKNKQNGQAQFDTKKKAVVLHIAD